MLVIPLAIVRRGRQFRDACPLDTAACADSLPSAYSYDGHPELMDALRAEENAIVQRVGNQSHTTTAIES
jgi:hypothetical protein